MASTSGPTRYCRGTVAASSSHNHRGAVVRLCPYRGQIQVEPASRQTQAALRNYEYDTGLRLSGLVQRDQPDLASTDERPIPKSVIEHGAKLGRAIPVSHPE